jgi:undecaprenyl-diphosphatase
MPENIQKIDEAILFFIQAHIKNPALDRVMVFITSLGNAGFIWLAAAFILLLLKRYRKCGISLICTIPLSMFICDNLLKPFFSRVRPCNKFPEVLMLIHRLPSPSFPSGHTTVSFASAVILYYYNKKLGIAGFITASLIAFSRLYLFVHYPTDILGGILLGTACSAALLYGLNKIYPELENLPLSS